MMWLKYLPRETLEKLDTVARDAWEIRDDILILNSIKNYVF